MKSEPVAGKRKMRNSAWTIDESKCLTLDEVKRLRDVCESGRITGLQSGKFTSIRNWFMIELGLNAGLRVQEIASLKHSNLLLDGDRSSL
ncbi:MAG: site-specific integrase, partial [Deltaproteobacteria bacterium]|nr:site-specific integrase [Deltaproteobacteria bacterium]